MMLPKTYSTLVIEDGDEETRDYTWAELFPSVFPSVFGRDAEFKPVFQPLGNEQGGWRLDIHWAHGEWDGPRPAVITVNTVADEEQDPDVIGDHQTIMYVWGGREAFRLAYSVARELVAGKLLPPQIPAGRISSITVAGEAGITIEPSRHHVAEAA